MKAVVMLLLLVACAVAFFVGYDRRRKAREESEQARLYEAFCRRIATSLRQNIERLHNGDLGWRRLGHGQATIGLKKIAPKKADVVPISLDRVKEKYPDVVHELRAIDAALDRTQSAANALAGKLEGPVRATFQDDRRNLLDEDSPQIRPFRKWLFDREDAWMEMLANLINQGQTLTDPSDPGAMYWKHSQASYLEVLDSQGGAERKELDELRARILEKSRVLMDRLTSIA